ncbi:MAG: alpha-L-rhamnosidase C-terminal domain-containing protein [Capsulimonadaceae bacterium]|nr:alpha-L-rhamnosidase C-terminal domain-containing protein [Capsulimonadaceae bacterium]
MFASNFVRRFFVCLASLAACSAAFASPPTVDPTYVPACPQPGAGSSAPAWIDARDQNGGGSAAFRRAFALTDAPTWTTLVVAASGPGEIFVNGHSAGRIEQSRQARQYDVATLLHPGRNVLAIRVSGASDPSIIAWLQIPGQEPIATNGSWRAHSGSIAGNWAGEDFSDSSWTAAKEILGRSSAASPQVPDGWPAPPKARLALSVGEGVNWIWASETTDKQTIYLRKTFDLATLPTKATLSATADDGYTAYVNGVAAATGSSWNIVQNEDVTRLLRKGRNVLAMRCRNEAGAAGAVAQIDADGKILAPTDLSWRVSTAPNPGVDWNAAGFNDADWSGPATSGGLRSDRYRSAGQINGWPGLVADKSQCLAHLDLPVAAVLTVHPGAGAISGAEGLARGEMMTVTPPPAGSTDPPTVLIDFGKELNGRVRVTSSGQAVVSVGTGESVEEAQTRPWVHAAFTLNPDPAVPPANVVNKIGSTPRQEITAAGASPLYTTITGARYALLTFPPAGNGSAERIGISFDHVYYPVTYNGSFDCSGERLTRMWYTGAYTAHLCMQDDIWDGVKRDRGLWSGDYEASGETIACAFGDLFLTERSIWRLGPQVPVAKHHINGIPGYSASWIRILANHYRNLGDSAFLLACHDTLLSTVDYMRGDLDAGGLFQNLQPHNDKNDFMYCDWCPGVGPNEDNPESRAITDLYYIEAFREAGYLFGQMGDLKNAATCAKLVDDMTAAARGKLLDTQSNTYGDRIQENTRAILAGVATSDQQAAIYARVLKLGSAGWVKPSPSAKARVITPYYLYFIEPVLSKLGHTDEAMQVARDCWGAMLDAGATTYWETCNPHWGEPDAPMKLPGFASYCHAWSSGVTSWLTEWVLGVRSTGPAYRTVVIAPDLAGLSWAAGDVPTPRGAIRVHASAAAGWLSISAQIPDGTTASVGVPGRTVRVDGKVVPSRRSADGRAFVTLTAPGCYVVEGCP